MSHWMKSFLCALVLLGLMQASGVPRTAAQEAVARKKVNSDADLPRFSYPLAGAPSDLLAADDATFDAFKSKVSADVESVLAGYEIEDKATMRGLLGTRFNIQMLSGDKAGALATLGQIRDLQEKPAAKASSGIVSRALLQAWTEAGAASGPAFEKTFDKDFAAAVNALPWDLVQDQVKGWKAQTDIASANLVLTNVKARMDPDAAKSKSLDFDGASQLLYWREYLKFALPLSHQVGAALIPYIKAHNVLKPDIWAAREVTLAESDKLTPVRVAIWDSGVDTALYPKQLFTDSAPGAHGPHGLAFDLQGKLYA